MAERWKPIEGYEGLYEVSSLGRVRSLDRVVWRRSRAGNLYAWTRPGRIMKQYRQESGRRTYRQYWQVNLRTAEGAYRHHMVHQLVARAFIGPCPPGKQIRHGAAGKLDNSVKNLSYGTPAENQADRRRDGTSNAGERNPMAKLSASAVADIRARHAAGTPQKELAVEYGVSRATISMLVSGQRWE